MIFDGGGFPADLKAAIKFVSAHLHDPAALIRKRKAVEGILNWAKSQLLPLSQRLALLAPEHVHIGLPPQKLGGTDFCKT